LIECDLRNKFIEGDIILIAWSSWGREDFFNVKKSQRGNIKWSATGGTKHSYDKKFIDTYSSVSNDLIKNSTAIISANRMFDIKFNGHMVTPIIHLHSDKALAFDDNEKELALFYENCIPNDGEFTLTKHPCSYALANERHPDIMSHLSYANEYICPKLNISLSDKTIDFFTKIHNELTDFIKTVSSKNTMFNSEKLNPPWYQIITKFMAMHGWHDMFEIEGF
jgi:hypothetical protein